MSLAAGETLRLHVATDAPRFRVALHRWGAHGFEAMGGPTAWQRGERESEGRPQDDWRWPACDVAIPRHWPSGCYVAHLQAEGEDVPLAAHMTSAAVLFVVRGAGRSRILYKLPFATYQAYNCTGGACYYQAPPHDPLGTPPGARLSWHRPGGGTGGLTFGAADAYDLTSPRQTFAHWDAPFIAWLLCEGHEVEFCADLDLHRRPHLLEPHRLLLSVGHDEYWSASMRDAVEGFVEAGGNAAFFGANVCWWRIHLVDGDSAMVCHQGGPRGALDHWWPATGAHRPEDALTGVSYRHGGGWWDGERDRCAWVVQRPRHWVLAGTGLALGARFGATSTPPLAGYECDGAPLQWRDEARGLVAPVPHACAAGTPAGFEPVAVAPLRGGWQELPPREGHAAGAGLHSATLGCHTRGAGTVFTAGTTDWAQVLANGSEPQVATITRNVIARLAA